MSGGSVAQSVEPWWQAVEEAAQLVASTLAAAITQAARKGVYTPPPGTAPPRRKRRPASLRHLAEVIRTHRLAPGVSVDKDMIAATLAGDPRPIANPILVVAVARAASLIAGLPFGDDDANRLKVASDRVGTLLDQAQRRDSEKAPVGSAVAHPVLTAPARPVQLIDGYVTTRRPRRWPVPMLATTTVLAVAAAGAVILTREDDPAVGGNAAAAPTLGDITAAPAPNTLPCQDGAAPGDIIEDTATVFDDSAATRLEPNLDFDAMNGSARYGRRDGRTFYWGRAGSDDNDPHSGGSRLSWRTADGPWHECATPLAVTERDYVRSPAVATTIGGRPVTLKICLWRDSPARENCTAAIKTG